MNNFNHVRRNSFKKVWSHILRNIKYYIWNFNFRVFGQYFILIKGWSFLKIIFSNFLNKQIHILKFFLKKFSYISTKRFSFFPKSKLYFFNVGFLVNSYFKLTQIFSSSNNMQIRIIIIFQTFKTNFISFFLKFKIQFITCCNK